MMICMSCSSVLGDNDVYYLRSNMGPEIMFVIENQLNRKFEENDKMCDRCFANIMQIMSMKKLNEGDIDVKIENEQIDLHQDALIVFEQKVHLPRDAYVCVYCLGSLHKKKTHCIPPGRERQLVLEKISPRDIPDNSLLCYKCWMKIRRIVLQEEPQGDEVSTEQNVVNTNICVKCLCTLSKKRSQAIQDGHVRDEIASKIAPRQIPERGRVCYACWMAAHRSVVKATSVAGQQISSGPLHPDTNCALCNASLFRRKTHILSDRRAKDVVAASIQPRQLPEHALLCTSCWTHVHDTMNQTQEEKVLLLPTQSTMELDHFRHTTNSFSHCFVPTCTNTDLIKLPNYVKKRILITQKIFVTENTRACREHRNAYNWDFLNKNDFSNSFTKNEMESMLLLSVQNDECNFSFENIESIDDNVFTYWTGITKEKYYDIFNIIGPTMKFKHPKTALGVFLMKARTGDSHDKIASLLCISKSTVTRLLDVAREALVTHSYPLSFV